MKELTIDEKAYNVNYKTYTELINRLEDVKNAIKKQNYGIATDILCNPYPEFQIAASTELKESDKSDDERIRKWLIAQLKIKIGDNATLNNMIYKAIAWLEKQGEPIDINPSEFDSQLNKLLKQFESLPKEELASSLGFYLNVVQNDGTYKEEKQGEQKPADKVEPKFHEGEWIVTPANKVLQITSIEGTSYKFDNESHYWEICYCDAQCHLWTIQDAKDGDVLFQDLMGGKTFIYNGVNPDMAILYSFIISNDGEDVLPYHIGKPNTGIGNIEENKNIIHPATKEQRDLLFQKMKEAGYEWDAEKKELKKIEQNPAWSEEK